MGEFKEEDTRQIRAQIWEVDRAYKCTTMIASIPDTATALYETTHTGNPDTEEVIWSSAQDATAFDIFANKDKFGARSSKRLMMRFDLATGLAAPDDWSLLGCC